MGVANPSSFYYTIYGEMRTIGDSNSTTKEGPCFACKNRMSPSPTSTWININTNAVTHLEVFEKCIKNKSFSTGIRHPQH